MDNIPMWLITSIGSLLFLFIGGYVKKWQGKLLLLINSIDEFLDVVREVIKAMEDKKLTADEWKKIAMEVEQFRLALDKLRNFKK